MCHKAFCQIYQKWLINMNWGLWSLSHLLWQQNITFITNPGTASWSWEGSHGVWFTFCSCKQFLSLFVQNHNKSILWSFPFQPWGEGTLGSNYLTNTLLPSLGNECRQGAELRFGTSRRSQAQATVCPQVSEGDVKHRSLITRSWKVAYRPK